MEQKPRRLYIFTGKGGVGKTTLSRAFVKYLVEHDHEAVYLTFKNQAMGETSTGSTERMHEGVKEIALDLEESARGYIEKRLNSKMVGGWIVKTPFFRALINMVPGFSYLIYLGKILEMGKENPRLTIVLDAPASGHALTMVESTTNFKQIFESGIVFDDATKMLGRLNDPSYTKIHVVSLPSLMSWQEAQELRTGLRERTPVDVDITVNNCLYPLLEGKFEEVPQGLREKALNEKRLVEEHQSEMQCILPHSLGNDTKSIESDLVGSLSKLI
ncbi:ArsA-related P-loop ATPase [Peredibacter starrii]|uniref:arsenite-transporting ATPase n=1 Tax=Peredibacter starrii TaxID=28202 RepID=A0AAX4HSA4_9BACT|nr:ArsA-related P-loop ATPase [Peredibacter starrii]WPU65973.1 ArsA-related P-loop ATPase [Peredibacter starrii]